jgi:Ca2+-binding EF-hand superfamily protein
MNASRLLIAGAAAALLPLAAAIAQSPTPDPAAEPTQPAQRQGATFESLDTDSDGKISKAEAAAHPTVSEQFARYDKNANGFIEREEVTATNSAPPENPGQ